MPRLVALKTAGAETPAAAASLRPTASPLVLLHGLGDTPDAWSAAFSSRPLAGRSLFAPSLHRAATTAAAPDPPHLEDVATELLDVLHAVRGGSYRRLVLVGHSLGGVVATLLAERWPEGIAGVVSVEGNLTPADCAVVSAAIVDAAGRDRTAVAGALDAMGTRLQRDGRASARYAHALREADPRVVLTAAEDLVRLCTDSAIGGRFARLGCPHLYVAGDAVPRPSADLLRRYGVPWTSVKGAGHWVMEDRPDALFGLIAEWAAGLHM